MSRTILLVEDNHAHAELVRRVLEEGASADHRLVHVEDGEAALDYVCGRGMFADRAAFPRPRLVLLDLRLPKVEGLEVLRHMKEDDALRDIPVVVLTTSEADRDTWAAYARHANSFLTKPADYEHLRRMLAVVREYWIELNQVPGAHEAF